MSSKAEKIKNFDPSSIGDANNNIYGLPFTCEEAEIIIIPVPWEVTVSYRAGTANGPEAVFDASFQVDLYDASVKDAWKIGLAMEDINQDIKLKNKALRKKTEKYLDLLSAGENPKTNLLMKEIQNEINIACRELNRWVKEKSKHYLDKNKIIGLLGGDHSIPLGLIQALAEKNNSFAILQIDAHADLRDAYEGFEFSHASIMFNAIQIPQVKQLIQVGIRDYCEAELNIINSNKCITTFFDRDIKHREYEGENWSFICDQIVKTLPEKVYVSFDIDGLDPKLCPNTGTPVAGGLNLEQAVYLIEKVINSGKKIIGFDVNEVAPGENEWDANVGARLLYRISNLTAKSNGKAN